MPSEGDSQVVLTKEEFRLLTWHRHSLNQMTIQTEPLPRHCPLDNGRLMQRAICNSTIGDLEILPPELVHTVLGMLDLRSLTDFRAVSWHAQARVDSLPSYNAIIKNSSDALRALISTNMAGFHTAQDIFNTLCTQGCFVCGQFGPFLDMFTGKRCCLPCVIDSDALLSITASSAKKAYHLSSKQMRSMATLVSLPGQYSDNERPRSRRLRLIRWQPVEAARPAFSRNMSLYDGHGENALRFMPMIRFPLLDQNTGTLEWGVSCQGCRLGPRHQTRGYCNWNRVYSTAGYMKHFQDCQVSQIGRKEIPKYYAFKEDQRMMDAKFLGFLDWFQF